MGRGCAPCFAMPIFAASTSSPAKSRPKALSTRSSRSPTMAETTGWNATIRTIRAGSPTRRAFDAHACGSMFGSAVAVKLRPKVRKPGRGRGASSSGGLLRNDAHAETTERASDRAAPMRAMSRGRVAPLQALSDDVDDTADHPAALDPRPRGLVRQVRLPAPGLGLRQPRRGAWPNSRPSEVPITIGRPWGPFAGPEPRRSGCRRNRSRSLAAE